MPTQRSPIYLNAAQKVSAISVFPPALQSVCLNDPVVSTSLSIGCTLPRPGSETHLQLAFPEHSVQLWKTCACVQLMMSVTQKLSRLHVHKASVSVQPLTLSWLQGMLLTCTVALFNSVRMHSILACVYMYICVPMQLTWESS